ncbi:MULTISPECIES: sensor domain-containing diguanylate cyclase [unclassified Guyparkeria]|uniref:GGDEF domain-containing protein n=1 Tax=unclassified Guyparkeria TaxID=2626246 RepID=UPI00073384EE|nr:MULTISPECIES: sensor domain-containing diguanylate cyclase [unclassified Guyparkeria]KTG16043.1 diguanylate cyclase [Guyparkeria sp. XI15]OAE84894.1 diguanylate cyclase [Guyparkeria sp. WRN-7]
MEPDHEVYRTLLESTKAIPWKIDWETLTFSYIGPQIEALLGWSPESWVGIDDWAERMHPDDRERVVNFCVAQSKAGADHEADYRALTRDGDYVWIRDVVHVMRDADGRVDSLVGFMFDISERKASEEKLLRLQQELEDLSLRDGLTGVANRRMFDSILEVEWANAKRHGQPISLVMLDIDYFKQYNDEYGHLAGDDCLKAVARVLESSGARAGDLLARFGGEEFLLLLPNTDETAAHAVADRCRQLILDQRILHATSPIGPHLSASFGVATAIPTDAMDALELLETADCHLYRAKDGGRNCVHSLA